VKFYQSREFKRVHDEWRERLEDSGFCDCEDKNGNTKNHDIRTIAWKNKEIILDFFLSLDHLMTNYPEMPKFERSVMELYSNGIKIEEIIREVKSSRRTVYNCITRYKNLVLAIQRTQTSILFPLSLRPQSNSVSEDRDEQRPVRDKAA
jgi:hypothetical protein